MSNDTLMPVERIERAVYLIRGQKVMLDRDLAVLYGVETKRLKEQVRRNADRFPDDFAFVLDSQEVTILRSQIATSSSWGGLRYSPMAFTEPKRKPIGFNVKERRARYSVKGRT